MDNAVYHKGPDSSNTGLRRNRYQSQIFTAAELKGLAPVWAERLKPLYADWKIQNLKPAEVAGLYLLIACEVRHPSNWIAGRLPTSIEKRGPRVFDWVPGTPGLRRLVGEDISLGELLSGFHLRGIRQVARQVLGRWLKNEIYLELTDHVPTSKEILDLQIHGGRWVSAVFTEKQLASPVHDGRDALSFLLHDLGHAGQFFADEPLRLGQVGSYRLMNHALVADLLLRPAHFSPQWEDQMHYFLADLNTHPSHFWTVFWAKARAAYGVDKVNEFFRWRDDLFRLWNWPTELRQDNHNSVELLKFLNSIDL